MIHDRPCPRARPESEVPALVTRLSVRMAVVLLAALALVSPSIALGQESGRHRRQ
jgi:hypothetical protein